MDRSRSCRHRVVAANNSQRGESGGGTPTLTKEYKDQPLASTLDSGRSVAEVARRAAVREMTSAKGEEPKDNGRVRKRTGPRPNALSWNSSEQSQRRPADGAYFAKSGDWFASIADWATEEQYPVMFR